MDFAVVKDSSGVSPIINVKNDTVGLCAVRVTKMSDGTTQYQSSNIIGNAPSNRKIDFTFNIETSAHYMVEAWSYNSTAKKFVPTAVKFI